MATEDLGALDLHGGGLDLVFPHHESEAAIWEALHDEPYCRHWAHNGFVTLNQAKMSKSTGNFLRLDEVLGHHDAEAVRLYLLSAHYRDRLDVDLATLADLEAEVDAWRRLLGEVQELAGDATPAEDAGVEDARGRFWAALTEDLHTETALEAAREVLGLGEAAVAEKDAGLAAEVLDAVREMGDALGLFWSVTDAVPPGTGDA